MSPDKAARRLQKSRHGAAELDGRNQRQTRHPDAYRNRDHSDVPDVERAIAYKQGIPMPTEIGTRSVIGTQHTTKVTPMTDSELRAACAAIADNLREHERAHEWPDDPTFRRVAARIADAVTVHINSGGRIVTADRISPLNCRCPLGCVKLEGPRFAIETAAHELGIGKREALDFANCFDGSRVYPLTTYGHLGLAYRRRFVEAAR